MPAGAAEMMIFTGTLAHVVGSDTALLSGGTGFTVTGSVFTTGEAPVSVTLTDPAPVDVQVTFIILFVAPMVNVPRVTTQA